MFSFSSSISLSRHQYHTRKSSGHAWHPLNVALHANKGIISLCVCIAIMMAGKKEGKKRTEI